MIDFNKVSEIQDQLAGVMEFAGYGGELALSIKDSTYIYVVKDL